jgi:predicted transcriptional regulator
MTATRTLTVEISEEQALRLERLAERTGRSVAEHVARALADHFDFAEDYLAGVETGTQELDRGDGIDHQTVQERLVARMRARKTDPVR